MSKRNMPRRNLSAIRRAPRWDVRRARPVAAPARRADGRPPALQDRSGEGASAPVELLPPAYAGVGAAQ